MNEKRFLAVDLGAESGRVMVGTLAGGKLGLEEIHRFLNEPATVRGTQHWDVLALYNHILKGMRAYVARYGSHVDAVGVDTWGVDFGLLAADGSLLQNPVCYRDSRTDGMPEVVLSKVDELELYRRQGIYMLPIYTLCQMVSMVQADSPVLACADTLLMMPDLMHYFMTGRKAVERSNAITTQLYDPRDGDWHPDIFADLDLPMEVMPEIVDPGTVLGELDPEVCAATGLAPAPVIAPCTHDTGSAVAGIPGTGDRWAFISSGTWSILGSLEDEVHTGEAALRAGLSNELTLGSLFLCRNIMGLWLLQRARAVWQREGEEYSYPELVDLAEAAPQGGPLVDPNDERFMAPENMVEEIRSFCKETGQTPPQDTAAVCRCIMESLALCYRRSLDKIAEILGRQFEALHIVGGGSQNSLLCQFTADACELTVLGGPVEATVAGNVLTQACGLGIVDGPAHSRQIIADSFGLVRYEPQNQDYWETRCEQYTTLVR